MANKPKGVRNAALFVHVERAGDLARENSDDEWKPQEAPKATMQVHMIGMPECGQWLQEPSFISEGARRGARRYMRLHAGGTIQQEQELLDQLGAELRAVRRDQERPMSEVAALIGIKPPILCFLESGWASKEEFAYVIKSWTSALDVDSTAYMQWLEGSITDQITEGW